MCSNGAASNEGEGVSESGALTADEVAAILRVSKNTVYNLVKREELAAYHVGRKMRFSRDDVANYVARRTGPRSELLEGSVRMPSVRSEASAFAVRARVASFVIAGNDILGDMLANYLGSVAAGSTFERVYEGSYAALCDLYAGRAHAALVHLYDRLSYNLPFVERLVPGVPVRTVRLVGRRQGLIVAKGNPRGLHAWEDLAREGVRLVNRERGCGSRVLFDEKMREFGLNARAVNGYDREVSSALTAASLVARGAADVCIGARARVPSGGRRRLPPLARRVARHRVSRERAQHSRRGCRGSADPVACFQRRGFAHRGILDGAYGGKQFINVNLHECGYGADHRFFVC